MTNDQLRQILESLNRAKEAQSQQERWKREFNRQPVQEPEAQPGIEHAKQLVACVKCGVLTANPVRLWKAGVELVDWCNPCVKKV
jgi:hypothetical protein